MKETSIRRMEIKEYKLHYLEQIEYQEMRKDLNKVLEQTECLANGFFKGQKMEQLMLALNLITMGYYSATSNYKYNANPCEIGRYYDKVFDLALTPFLGEGCCRHSSSLLKMILDKLEIKNEIVAVDTENIDENVAKIKIFLSEFHKKTVSGNHFVNYVSIDNYEFFVNPSFDWKQPTFYYNDDGLLKLFSQDGQYEKYPCIFNYSLLFEGKKNFTEVPSLSLKEQKHIKDSYDKVTAITMERFPIINLMKCQNQHYVEDIKKNYQKVLVKERKLGIK